MRKASNFIFFFFFFSMLILLIFPIVSADISEYSEEEIVVNLSGKLSSDIPAKISANLALVPLEDERQEILDMDIFGDDAEKKDGEIIYNWQNLESENFGWSAKFKTKLYLWEIDKKEFPTKINSYEEAKAATEKIDITSDIIKKANELVAGQTELHKALLELAQFVSTNISYDESYTQTTLKASEVLQKRRGVCDEYTILFMALARALGIPARYVSGVAYSNIKKDFGEHAWAEVYDGQNWIPFDITFNQFGWLDVSHVALSKSFDVETNFAYTYPSNAKVEAEELNITTSATPLVPLEGKLQLNAEPLKKEVGAGSYVPLKVEISNPYPYIIPVALYLTKAPGIEGKNQKSFFVEGKNKEVAYFLLKIPEAKEGEFWKAAIEVKTQFNDTASSDIFFSTNYKKIDKKTALEMIESAEPIYMKDIFIVCSSQPVYRNEQTKLICNISSQANIMFYNLKLCLAEKCEAFDLPIGAETIKEFDIIAEKETYDLELSNGISKTIEAKINILEKPNLSIKDVWPKTLNYNNNNLSLTLKTASICRNASVKINSILYKIGNIEGENVIQLSFEGKHAPREILDIEANCYDLKSRKESAKKTFSIELINLPWYARLKRFFLKLFKR